MGWEVAFLLPRFGAWGGAHGAKPSGELQLVAEGGREISSTTTPISASPGGVIRR